VVVITPQIDPAAFGEVQRLGRSFSSVTTVLLDESAWDPDATEGPPAAGRRVVRISRSAPFPEAWHRSLSTGVDAVGARV
jgi:hypothetical protein